MAEKDPKKAKKAAPRAADTEGHAAVGAKATATKAPGSSKKDSGKH
jgi:hypothetical protein